MYEDEAPYEERHPEPETSRQAAQRRENNRYALIVLAIVLAVIFIANYGNEESPSDSCTSSGSNRTGDLEWSC